MRGDKEEMQRDAVFEALYNASLKKTFISDVQSIRQRHKIPLQGDQQPKGLIKSTELNMAIGDDIQTLLQKYKLPLTGRILVEEFVISNSFEFPVKPNHFACEYETFHPPFSQADRWDHSKEAQWKRAGKPFVRIYLPQETSLKNAQAFLKAHWAFFSKFAFNKTLGQKSSRRSTHQNRDALILSYASKSRKELGLSKGEYPNIRIATLLNKEHGYKGITPEIVQSVINRKG